MSVIHNDLLLSTDEATGYNLTKSLRFRSAASAYLSRTPASTGNRKTWTWSGWVKRGTLGGTQAIFGVRLDDSNRNYFNFGSDSLSMLDRQGGTTNTSVVTPAVFRDPSAWYHVVWAIDTTQATSTNRIKVYVNGIQQTLTFNTTPSQNTDLYVNTTQQHKIGDLDGSVYFDGYLAETNFIDGQALTPASFGETDTITGVWKPKKYTGTYGTNGFYLPFTDVATTSGSNAGLGKDFSGNGNYWTTNNISVTAGNTYDSMTDVPTLTDVSTANYCVLNPLASSTNASISAGNLEIYVTNSSDNIITSTMRVPSGMKAYYEATPTSGNRWEIGVSAYSNTAPSALTASGAGRNDASTILYAGAPGTMSKAGTGVDTGSTYTNGDVIGVTIDNSSGTPSIRFYKNNTVQGTGAITGVAGDVYACFDIYNSSGAAINFGQRPFAYTPPTGFVALNTYNLPTSTIVAGNTVMDATTYTGNGSTQTITNAGAFKPDLIWIKSRSNAYNNFLTNSVAGASQYLISNATDAEANAGSAGITAFNTNGFSMGSGAALNANAATYVAWQWQAGQGSTSSNTNGSITSTVSVNATAGFSIVTYTGTGTNATVGHGLGVTPKMFIVKNRSTSQDWRVYTETTGANNTLFLNATDGSTAASTGWNNTAPTSSVFSIGTSLAVNQSGSNFVAYCWSEIAGFSKFGYYTGNGSTDGPFVYLGFRPKFILIKRIDAAQNWALKDTARDPSNVSSKALFAQLADTEYDNSSNYVDILSNGFKIRTTDTGYGASGGSYTYMAFAENPFKNSLAR